MSKKEDSNLLENELDNKKKQDSKIVNKGTEKGKNELKKKIQKNITKKIGKTAAKQSIATALTPIIAWVVIIIIAIIIIIGILMFFITMPGMVMQQLKELFKEVGCYIASFFGADITEQIEDIEIYQTLDYLEEMGWDLKSEGFITGYLTEDDLEDVKNDSDIEEDRRNSAILDEKIGVIRDSDDKILKADSDFIFLYMMSDNYCFTLKNDNITNKDSCEKYGWFGKITGAISSAWYKFKNLFYGPIFDAIGLTNNVGESFGKGLICLYYDAGLGEEGTFVNQDSLWNWDSIKIDVQKKVLSIARNDFLNNNNAIEFSLDGWTGRYGMPLEFLLAIHKSTMMPDLAADMIKSFQTEVDLYLHDVSGEAIGAYKTQNGEYLNLKMLNNAFSNLDGSNFFSGIITWFDNLSTSDKEAQLAFKMGIEHSPNCTCTKEKAIVYSYDGYNVNGEEGNFQSINKGDLLAQLSHLGENYTATIINGNDNINISFLENEVIKTESDTEIYTNICQECKDHISYIMDYCTETNDFNFKTYSPYIKGVRNHWYRDVAFVLNSNDSKQFVDYDYDYEALTKERWTLYETDNNGDYKYYEVDDNGNLNTSKSYTKEEADKKNIKVIKKAELVDMANELTRIDLGWNAVDGSDSLWSAYELKNENGSNSYEPAYTQEQIDEEENEDRKAVMKNVFVSVNTTGNIVQVGEGMRYETNSTIKKMFLNNRYFRYDGNEFIAESITKLRKNHKDELPYGALSDEVIKKNYSVKVNDETYTIKDLSGNVSLNQDSLNAFSILENMHTLDSDYIYRDFKELIVELGYFEKEELTDEIPKLLEFIVPDIGSAGYPLRSIDKSENEFGTMIHSKGDIEVSEKLKLAMLMNQVLDSQAQANGSITATEKLSVNNNLNGINISSKKYVDLTSIKALEGDKSLNEVSVEDLLGKAREMMEEMQTKGYAYCLLGGENSPGISHSDHTLQGTYGNSKSMQISTTCCATYVSWVLQEVGLFADSQHQDSAQGVVDLIKDIDGIEVLTEWSELEPGDLLFFSDTDASAAANFAADAHVEILGENIEGSNFTYYNAGHYVTSDNPGIQEKSDWGSSHPYHFAVRLPLTGVKKQEADVYTGYEGNEAVVSPVTGILLDYGIYDSKSKTDVDSITGLPYRVNTDLKYGNMYEEKQNKDKNIQGNNKNDREIQIDSVGYAKILVLDEKYYEKFEKDLKEKSQVFKDTKSLLSNTGNYRDFSSLNNKTLDSDTIKEWEISDYTLYGYKEFAENYKASGISGHIIYIDGFIPELPDTEINNQGSTQLPDSTSNSGDIDVSELIPNGETIKKDEYFNQINKNNINTEVQLESLYESEEDYKMSSKKATEKLNTEIKIKSSAASTYSFKDKNSEIIILKEGTVIGRTITDKELVTKIREQDEEKYYEYRPDKIPNSIEPTSNENDKDEKIGKVMGNYLRIYMKNNDETTVENVEDYMKLDILGNLKTQDDFFSVVGTVISKEEWVELAYAYTKDHGDSTFKDKANLGELYDFCVGKGVNPEYILARGIQESGLQPSNGNNYWGYNTPNGSSSLWDGGTWQNVLDKYCNTILKYQDPSTSEYNIIMQRYQERKEVTEYGGVDPLGYGPPDTIGGQQCLYSWLGDTHKDNNSGDGGMYYLYPWGWGGNQYEGENKIIFESKDEFEQICGSHHGTSGGRTSNTPTTVWEQGMYTAYQARGIVKIAKNIFGERAGTYGK